MTSHNIFYYPYASLTKAHSRVLKMLGCQDYNTH